MLTVNRVVSPSPDQWDIVIEGMRNPMNSWDKSDSGEYWEDGERHYTFGRNDMALMKKLSNAGKDHRKYMRMLPVWLTVTAPRYWWSEYDTYKVGTVANSCSTMHKIHAKEFTLDDFSHENLAPGSMYHLNRIIDLLNETRYDYLNCTVSKYATAEECNSAKKQYWWQLIQLLPSSYNQRRTLFLNYEVLANIYHARRNHKLDEWYTFCDFIHTLPLSYLITGEDDPSDVRS